MIEIEDQNCEGDALGKYYKSIIEHELASCLYIERTKWPKEITFELFSTWFTYQYHESVYDLSEAALEIFDE